ncbi:NAD-P-binding protein [Sistotremastrum niveocremeum HHB9708]|uniref:NAD-P-binding protein n=1 Tax=Sistotremastrum niveocremeum HHB9708 TaxID=1314777 RepID=A0A164ZMQ0_9AGAM|nr:NAD-P-binding protein [Sistotremastrum niveocremeum HHB9708]
MAAPTSTGILVSSESIARPFREDIIETLKSSSKKPRLVGILSTSAAPSRFYAEFTKKTCDDLQIDFVLKTVGAASPEGGQEGEGVEEAIIECNEDSNVDGIMVYYPIFGGTQDQYLQQVVSPYKDVEGLHFKFHYNLYHNIRFVDPKTLSNPTIASSSNTAEAVTEASEGTVKSILPCTPLAIVKCLEHMGVYNKILPYGNRAYGKTVTVINRSEVVGRPLAALLSNDGSRVFSADIDSIQEYNKRSSSTTGNSRGFHPHHVVHPCSLSLQECLAISDVVVSAVPSPNYKVKTEWLKDGCICINVSSDKNFEKDVREKASIYLPTIGKVTILMLLRNL